MSECEGVVVMSECECVERSVCGRRGVYEGAERERYIEGKEEECV